MLDEDSETKDEAVAETESQENNTTAEDIS